jgi:hypothetical protein
MDKKMRSNHFDQNKIIEFIFENNKKQIDFDKYVFNEGPAFDKLKDKVKDMGKAVVAVAAFRMICMYLSVVLNRNWQTKKRAFPIIKSIWKESMEVLRFFLNSSNLDKPLYTALQSFYSWELSMAAILIYEAFRDGKGISETKKRIKSLDPEDFKTYINSYAEKIKSGAIGINKFTYKVEEYGSGGSPGSGGPGGSPGPGGSGSITSADISKIFNFLKNPTSPLAKISKNYPGDYRDFIKLFKEAKSGITGLSSDAAKGLEQIIDTLEDNESEWNGVSTSTVSILENQMRGSIITFPNSTTMTDGTNSIGYSSGGYTVPDGFNFSKVQNAALGPGSMNTEQVKLKFMFLFAFALDSKKEKDYIIKELINNFSFVKNRT